MIEDFFQTAPPRVGHTAPALCYSGQRSEL
jgi:hypothetical protein